MSAAAPMFLWSLLSAGSRTSNCPPKHCSHHLFWLVFHPFLSQKIRSGWVIRYFVGQPNIQPASKSKHASTLYQFLIQLKNEESTIDTITRNQTMDRSQENWTYTSRLRKTQINRIQIIWPQKQIASSTSAMSRSLPVSSIKRCNPTTPSIDLHAASYLPTNTWCFPISISISISIISPSDCATFATF